MTKLRPYVSVTVNEFNAVIKRCFSVDIKVHMEERIGTHQKRTCFLGIKTYSKSSLIKTGIGLSLDKQAHGIK